MQFYSFSQRKSGSSLLSPAHGCGGARATIEFNNSPSAKKSGEARKQAGKKKKGCGENEFLPACQSAEGGQWGGGVSAIPLARGRQNRKIFFSLIEKNLGGRRLKKCRENFSVLLAVAKRRQAETLGGIQSAKSSGFCSKKVRISSNRHHPMKTERK
jgi:hypothetical protein